MLSIFWQQFSMEMLMFLHVFALKQGPREDNGLATVQNRHVKNFVIQTGKSILEIFMDYKYAFYCLSWSAELIKLHYLCV